MHNAYVLWNQEELRIAFDTSFYIKFENILVHQFTRCVYSPE